MKHRAADARLTPGHGGHRADARACVLVDIRVERFHEPERFVLAEDLHQRGQHEVSGARRVRVRQHDLALVNGIDEVFPAFGNRQLALFEHLGVVAQGENAAVNARDAVFGKLGFSLCPVL